MTGVLYLALRYIRHYRGRSLLLLLALTITLTLPLATHWTMQRMRTSAMARSATTPLVVGAKGSRFSLALQSLYFRGEALPSIAYSQLERIAASGAARAIPMLAKFRAQGHAIIGTRPDYLDYRQLKLSEGEPLQRWGDCLIGANVASGLGLHAGDALQSEPENMFDLSGATVLNLRIRGVLQSTRSADDDVIFCHLETAWILAGIGHGHQPPSAPAVAEDTNSRLSQAVDMNSTDEPHAHASRPENQQNYQEITSENLASYHFHGRKADYPLSCILIVPDSDRTATLLEGKYLGDNEPCQIIRPPEVIAEILQVVERLERWLNGISLVLGLSTALLVILILLLSVRLRQSERVSLMLLGCSRWTIARLMVTELALIALASLGLALGLAAAIAYNCDALL